MDILLGILRAVLFVVIAYAVVFVAALANILYERRFMAFIGDRLGPNRTGPQGLLQSVADAFKMMGKEDFRPALADPVLFTLAPVTVMIGAVAIQLVIPYTNGLLAVDLDVGLIFLVAITSFTTLSKATAATMPSWRSVGTSVRAPKRVENRARPRAAHREASPSTADEGGRPARRSKVCPTALSWRPM